MVNHTVFVCVFKESGIGSSSTVMTDNRYQRIKIVGIKFNLFLTLSGVPIWGHFSFIIKSRHDSNLLQNSLSKLSNSGKVNDLALNARKCKYTFYNRSFSTIDFINNN